MLDDANSEMERHKKETSVLRETNYKLNHKVLILQTMLMHIRQNKSLNLGPHESIDERKLRGQWFALIGRDCDGQHRRPSGPL